MTEVANTTTDYAFNELGFTTLIFVNPVDSIGSRHVKEKAGAVFLRTKSGRLLHTSYTESDVWKLTNIY